jgi:EAL domain-containing protein (putative c-di-GMP-specific phosphodiesterase class I)
MHVFENPYIIIASLAIGVVVLAAISICFAVRGLRAANGQTERSFTSISKMESRFKAMGKSRSRLVLYINLSTDNLRISRSEQKLFLEIKHNLLYTFANGEESFVAAYDDKNYIVIANLDAETVKEQIETCINDINKILLKHCAFNVVIVRIGSYDSSRIQVNFDDAVARAKQACLLAKTQKTSYAEWTASSGKALEKKIKIENNIEKEIDNNRFFLEYQPVLDAKTKKIIGAEVLSRLNSESEGILAPKSFLSAVDSVGINEKFDYYIFEKNCKWISNDKKQREGYKYTINFSRSTISEPEFVEKITNIAEKYDLKFSCLAVEILEDKNITGEAKQQMIDNLSLLKEKGISILLDDFGSGYTTFGDLQNLDISIIKIDKSITQNSVTETGFKILKNIIQTAKDIGFKTLCEGIETKEQEDAAIEAGCDLLQGFYYYKPMSVTTLENLFDNV